MLKDNIQRYIDKRYGRDFLGLQLRGKLEVFGKKDGEIFHYDAGDNTVTIWTKHMMMHLLTGEMFTTHGTTDEVITEGLTAETVYSKRSSESTDHTADTSNADGTVISGEKYLGDNTNYYNWIAAANLTPESGKGDDVDAGDVTDFDTPFNPTKMLFGTGFEYDSWASVVSDGKGGTGEDGYQHADNGGWTESTFNDLLISGDTPTRKRNYYSNIWGGSYLTQARTVNDVYSGGLSTDPTDTDFAISGAIKDGTYTNVSQSTKIADDGNGNYFLTGSYRGIGRPSFVYVTRASRFMEESSDILLSIGSTSENDDLESKITYTVTLPSQPSGTFYPYNGYTLKNAGLFTDARMLLNNSVPDGVGDDSADELNNYRKMPGGIMLAKRNIYPIYKSHAVEITARWTVYL